MNNSSIVDIQEDEEDGIDKRLKTEEARLVRIIEAVQGLQSSREWSSLKTEVFDHLVSGLEKDLKAEAKKEDPDPRKLNRLAGELKWAEKYADLKKLEDLYRIQLQGVRKNLHDKKTD